MQVLQNVHVHDQRLTTAGSAHERQLIQFIYCVWLKINETKRLGFLFVQPCIQISTKCFRIGKVPIQIHFREEQSDILKILPAQSAAFFTDLSCVAANIFIIQAQFFCGNGGAFHSANEGDILVKAGVAAFIDAFVLDAVQFLAECAK